jgi:hypothetical protein
MVQAEKKFYVFYNRVPNSSYIFPDGTIAAFTGGRYATDDEAKAQHLTAVAQQGNPHIFVDPAKMQLTESELDPMAELKARIREQVIQELATKKDNDMGSSTSGKLNIADSNTIGEAAAGSDSGAAGMPASTPAVGAVKISLPTSK